MLHRKHAWRRTPRYTDTRDTQRPSQATPFTFADACGDTQILSESWWPHLEKRTPCPSNLPVLDLPGAPHSPGPGPAELPRTWGLAEA